MGLFNGIQGKALLGACLLLTLSLSACDTKAPDEPADVTSDAASALAVQVTKSVEATRSTEATKSNKEKPKKKLNLTLTDDVMATSQSDLSNAIDIAKNDFDENNFDENNFDENNTLPNMFGKKQEGTTVGGGVIRDAENEDYVDSIQGAEVNVEFKID